MRGARPALDGRVALYLRPWIAPPRGHGLEPLPAGLHKALTKEHGRYGQLVLPLVIAIESDTMRPTRNYDRPDARRLVGPSPQHPLRGPRTSQRTDSGSGYRVKAQRHSAGDHLDRNRTVERRNPARACVDHALPDADAPIQPSGLSKVESAESVPVRGTPLAAHFALDEASVSLDIDGCG